MHRHRPTREAEKEPESQESRSKKARDQKERKRKTYGTYETENVPVCYSIYYMNEGFMVYCTSIQPSTSVSLGSYISVINLEAMVYIFESLRCTCSYFNVVLGILCLYIVDVLHYSSSLSQFGLNHCPLDHQPTHH